MFQQFYSESIFSMLNFGLSLRLFGLWCAHLKRADTDLSDVSSDKTTIRTVSPLPFSTAQDNLSTDFVNL